MMHLMWTIYYYCGWTVHDWLSLSVGGSLWYVPPLNPSVVSSAPLLLAQFTNWQSRTALVIMPALFVFTLTSEQKMLHRMEEVAQETEHAIRSVEWADQINRAATATLSKEEWEQQEQLRSMYRQSILQSGVRVVDSPHLLWYHQAANYVQANPFKVVLGIGVPAVVGIFYGKSGKDHCK